MPKHLFILSKNWSRHGNYSGYEQITNYLNGVFNLVDGFKMPTVINSFFIKKTNLANYKQQTVSKEILLLSKVFRKKTIYVQYGDMDYYYLHYLKRFPFNLMRHTLIATFHHPPYELETRFGYDRARVLGALDKIIVMGPNQISFFEAYTKAEIRFIPHGIDTDFFHPDSRVLKKNQILLIGVSHRDHDRNIAIIREVRKHIETAFVVLIPKGSASLYIGLDGVEVVTKNISDAELLLYYQSSKGLLLSLIDCTASNAILEALACGCPIITNLVGAVKDYIPETSGVPVFETDDLDGSVRYIIQLLEDTTFLNDISRKQHALAQKYDWKVIAKTTEDFIFPQL